MGPEQLLLNDGAGVFTDGSAQLPPPVPIFDDISADARFADIDGDGDLDVLVPNAGQFIAGHGFLGGPDRYFRNNGRAKFKERTDAHSTPPDDPTTDAAFGDIDGDVDLVVGNSGENGGERVFVNRPNGH